MNVLPLTRRLLADSWRGILGWTLAIVAVLSLYLPLYPSIAAGGQLQELLASMPPALIESLGFAGIASGPGYTQATYFGLLGFVLPAIAGIGWGAAALAGDEEEGRLELTLAHAVTRSRVLLERALAIMLKFLVMLGVGFLMILALNGPGELKIDPAHLVAAVVAQLGLATLTFATAYAIGAATGRRSWAVIAGALVAVGSYLLNAVGAQSPDVAWLRHLSPIWWAYGSDPLTNGWDAGIAWPWLAAAVLFAGGWAVFTRRDVTG
ncbi:MAG: ABC transporter permease [Leifsonia xyli]|nr:MAG: ABC transporter permease [Leifsonia xyli]